MADEGYQPFPDVSAWAAVPFDPTTYEQYVALLEQARAEASEEARKHSVKTAIRYAGTDTGAIEGLYTTDRGFTRTVAIEAANWEAAANERGPNAAAIIKDQIEAYEWVLDLVTQQRPVTEHVIRELHAMLCRSQATYVVHTEVGPQERTLPKGEYKQFPNNPTSLATGRLHHYAPPDMVGPEMARLVAAVASDEYASAHPVVQAAFLHYSLAAVHPFADGNGRVSRALAAVPLYRAIRVPLVVFRDQRDEYLDALEHADVGDLQPFLSFVRERVIEAADLVTDTARAGASANHAKSVERLRQIATSIGGRKHLELDAVANRLLDVVDRAFATYVPSLPLPANVSVTPEWIIHGTTDARPGYRIPHSNPRQLQWTGRAAGPVGAATFSTLVGVHIAMEPRQPELMVSSSNGHSTGFAVRDIDPVVREVAKVKVAAFVERAVGRLLADVAERSEAELRRSGYLP